MYISVLYLPALVFLSATLSQPVLATKLVKRQVTIATPSPLPSQCASTCSPISNEVNLGCPVEACCTTTFETEYFNCLECVGTALSVANFSAAQNNLNLLWTTCVDVGFVLPRLELPGQTNSTATASATALFPTASSSSSGAMFCATGRAVHVEALISVIVFLALAPVW